MSRRILITGAAGYIGSQLARQLQQHHYVVGVDIRKDESADFPFYQMDIRDPKIGALMKEHGIHQVVHLAAVLEDSGDRARDFDIDVNGTRNVLDACVASGATQLVVTSSGAAYGYYADNPAWLDEQDPLRGNPEFPYSDHKRQVEELLADYREKYPALKQLVLRPGTVLGADTRNLIPVFSRGNGCWPWPVRRRRLFLSGIRMWWVLSSRESIRIVAVASIWPEMAPCPLIRWATCWASR